MRVFAVLALSMALLAPIARAQKPPSPSPPPPTSNPPTRMPTPTAPSVDPTQSRDDRVMFLLGRISTNDGSPVPNDAMVERICNNKVRQQVYTSPNGDFSMQLGSRNDTFVDASGDMSSPSNSGRKDSAMGISKHELMNCEIRATVRGFHSPIINLVDLDNFGGRIDLGVIRVQRGAKPEGMVVSAASYKVPNDARKAYQKGLAAEKKSDLVSARKNFETAVAVYPKYATAWYELGNVLQKQNQADGARKAYIQATTIDNRFLPPFLSLASMAYEEQNWSELLSLTDHILAHDPLNPAYSTAYIVDLDNVNCTEAYFYNAIANYQLNNFEAAEKSGLKAENVGMLSHLPQVHLLLGEIFARKNDYANAITEFQTYLELTPQTKNAEQVREILAKLQKLNASVEAPEPRNHE